MSAVVLFVQEQSAIVATDTVSYTADGILGSSRACKVVPMLELNCIIGNVGAGNFSPMLRAHIGLKNYQTFDDLLAGFETDFAETLSFMVLVGHALPDTPCTAFVVGWSELKQRMLAYRVSRRERQGQQLNGETFTMEAFKRYELENWISCTVSEDERFEIDFTKGDPYKRAARIICACRAASLLPADSEDGEAYYVGGKVQLFGIERGTILSSVWHEWPDEAGQLMDKFAGDPLPPHMLDDRVTDEAQSDGDTAVTLAENAEAETALSV